MRRLATLWLLALFAEVIPAAPQAPAPGPEGPPFWETRPYEQWTGAETLALLTDSPWSHAATLVEPGVEVHSGKLQYFVQWYSAQVLREGLVRLRHLQAQVDPPTEAKFLASPRPAYQLYIFAGFFSPGGDLHTVPLEVFEGMTREELQASVRLIFSSQEYTAHPDRIEMLRNVDTQQLVGLRFNFERAHAAVPPEQALQGEVRLICPTKTGVLSVSFLLNDMRRRGQPDL